MLLVCNFLSNSPCTQFRNKGCSNFVFLQNKPTCLTTSLCVVYYRKCAGSNPDRYINVCSGAGSILNEVLGLLIPCVQKMNVAPADNQPTFKMMIIVSTCLKKKLKHNFRNPFFFIYEKLVK